jgi:hypothetical protein
VVNWERMNIPCWTSYSRLSAKDVIFAPAGVVTSAKSVLRFATFAVDLAKKAPSQVLLARIRNRFRTLANSLFLSLDHITHEVVGYAELEQFVCRADIQASL